MLITLEFTCIRREEEGSGLGWDWGRDEYINPLSGSRSRTDVSFSTKAGGYSQLKTDEQVMDGVLGLCAPE
jgi:hypothetical protein